MTSQWNSFANYVAGNQVQNGSSVVYSCILANVNQPPPNATYWVASPAGSLQSYFIDSALPSITLDSGASVTEGIDITPPFFAGAKHFLITWSTLFTAGAPVTGSIKWGVGQNAVPFALPINGQESSQLFDVSTAITVANGNQVLWSVTVVYLTEIDLPPNITLWYQSTSLDDAVTVAVREVAVTLLD